MRKKNTKMQKDSGHDHSPDSISRSEALDRKTETEDTLCGPRAQSQIALVCIVLVNCWVSLNGLCAIRSQQRWARVSVLGWVGFF